MKCITSITTWTILLASKKRHITSLVSSLQPTRPRPIALRRIAPVIAVCRSDVLLIGLIFGWAPLLLRLRKEDQYPNLGPISSESMCEVHENHPNVMFVAASVALNAGALPVGLLLDRVEPRVPIAVAAFIEVAGWSLLDRLDSRAFHMFVPAYIIFTFGGRITMMWSFPASFVTMRYQTAILAAISCLVDGSSAMFLVMYAAYEHCGWSGKMLSPMMSVVAAIVDVVLIVLWGLSEDRPAIRKETECWYR